MKGMNMNIKEPIRILHILGSIQRGGTESVVLNYYRVIDRKKVQFDLVIDENSPCDIPKEMKDLGCVVYKIPPYTNLPKYITSIRKICKQGNYKIIHSHMNTMSVFPLFAAWLAKVPVRIAHSHSSAGGGKDFKRDLLKYMLRPFSKIFATKYFACSEYAARWLFGSRVVDKGEVFVLNNAIETGEFAFQQRVRDEQRKILKVEDKFVVGHVGRFSPPKNHFFLIEVFKAFCKIKKNSVLLLVGGMGSAGEGIQKKLHKRIKDLGLQEKVYFLGTREHIGALYQAMDVFLLPSLYEGLAMVCIEAQCAGLLCVVSDRVPKEAKIQENVIFMSLDEPPEKWARAILENHRERVDGSWQVASVGYDVNTAADDLEKAYLSYIEHLQCSTF